MPINSDKSSPPLQCPNCLQKAKPRTATVSTEAGAWGKVHKKIDGEFSVYFCNSCHNGFTHPTPKHIEKYYHDRYWTSSSFIGKIKHIIFGIFHKRRASWVTKTIPKGIILDVGSGEGEFGTTLSQRYKVVNIEPPTSSVKSKSVIKRFFLEWKTKQKFDAVCFWESLEHTPSPQKYLEKAYKLLKKGGFIFIEYPRYNSFESNIFGKNWFHLDLPRHLSHLTDHGLRTLLKRTGFTDISIKSVPSFDYTPWGFVASVLESLGISLTDDIKKAGSIIIVMVLLPLILIGFVFEVFLIIISQSPIGLAVAKKK